MVVTDAFQMIVIYAGIITLIVSGSSAVGGMNQVWKVAQESGRLKFNKCVKVSLLYTLFQSACVNLFYGTQ